MGCRLQSRSCCISTALCVGGLICAWRGGPGAAHRYPDGIGIYISATGCMLACPAFMYSTKRHATGPSTEHGASHPPPPPPRPPHSPRVQTPCSSSCCNTTGPLRCPGLQVPSDSSLPLSMPHDAVEDSVPRLQAGADDRPCTVHHQN